MTQTRCDDRILLFWVFSLVLHLAMGALLIWVPHAEPPRHAPIIVELAPPPPSKASEEQSTQKKIVQTDLVKKEKKAAKDAYLGAQTQVVDRETVSAQKLQDQVVMEQRKRTQQPQAKAARPLAILGVPLKLGEKKQETPNEIDRGDQTMPTVENRSAQEYLRGFKESDRTLLNTKEYVFFSYFQRIRQRLDTAWQPLLRDHIVKLYKRGRQLASEMDHKTQVLVVLNSFGEIVRVQMVEESGVLDLDQAAVEAFNQAGPFPNPPRGLVDTKGRVEIRWDFILKT